MNRIASSLLALQFGEQFEHLRLHRDVERGGRFVARRSPPARRRVRGRSRSAAAGRPRIRAASASQRRPQADPRASKAPGANRALRASARP